MTLTPFMILILTGYALFIGVLAVVSIWSHGGSRRAAVTKPRRAEEAPGRSSPSLST